MLFVLDLYYSFLILNMKNALLTRSLQTVKIPSVSELEGLSRANRRVHSRETELTRRLEVIRGPPSKIILFVALPITSYPKSTQPRNTTQCGLRRWYPWARQQCEMLLQASLDCSESAYPLYFTRLKFIAECYKMTCDWKPCLNYSSTKGWSTRN